MKTPHRALRFTSPRLLTMLLIVGTAGPPAQAVKQSMAIRVAGYDKPAVLTNFPLLVVFNEGRTNFLYSQFITTNGADLRVYDAAETNELAYEIETWNTNGDSMIWVRMPLLSGSNDYIRACWGDPAETNAPAYTTNGAVWNADYRLVLHMGSGADSSTNRLGGNVSNVVFAADNIGNVGWFNGTNSRIAKNHSTALKPSSTITISAWVKSGGLTTQRYRNIYRKEDLSARHILAFQEFGTIVSFGLHIAGVYNELDVSISAANYTDGWHLVTGVYDGTAKRLYSDGVQIGISNNVGALDTAGTAKAYIGCTEPEAEWYLGGIDELNLSGTARSSNWVWACYMSQKAGSTFLCYEPVVPRGTVMNLDDGGPDSLRGRLQLAVPGDTIQFNEGLEGTLVLTNGPLTIPDGIALEGPGPASITISGNGANRIFTANGVTASVSGLTFSNGLASGSNGGALYQAGGDITFSNCVFVNNRSLGADGAAGGWGGAIYATGGVTTVRDATFSANVAKGPRGLPPGTDNRSGGGGGGSGLG
nr:DUF2341 domain-containing protein [Kiritimatiellia bacterium]